ncbi:RNA polymerase sigma-70 factor (ECF subfamily) [Bacteroides zoogleoformans]|uniref:RNA polymerase sigma-70 factor n=1 Tax=Bacteroides zoogleoformans TaxID=28119 RepID=A0ABM6T8C9_9BACE|nr:RNA polymerase sigma-70 factor [Bacteroides zoogleoformans]AVM53154.1 RNA polymerase sigma-70 factor [Bacteroides zoogleoformans]TWJ17920.1 RNA polymerase sigma-70 factor (ECF subfamily) [Bacteroides zoogleoformans]
MKETDSDIVLFNKLFNEYRARFVRFASTYVDDLMEAEDIVMEAMMYYWENRARIKSEKHPEILPYVYVFTAVKNKCLNHLRNRRYDQMLSEQIRKHEEWKLSVQMATLEACDPRELFSKEVREQVRHALAKLPETTRKIFIMHHFEEKTHREIAALMNLSVKGVEYHMTKAIRSLKKSLKHLLFSLLFM